jgi:DNA repair exonuclease SbcCD ATPase subunit
VKQKIKDRNGKERILDERSLENLKLGPIFRDQGKQRFNTTLRPETIAWLKRGGNASQRIEDLVDAARSGYLQGFQVDKTTDTSSDELEKLKTQVAELKAQVAQLEGQLSALELIDEYLAEHELTERIKDLNKNRTLQYLGKFKAWLLKR